MIQEKQLPDAVLRQPWLNITRAAWILITSTAFFLAIMGWVNALGEPLPFCTTEGATCGPWSVSQEDLSLAQQAGLPDQLIIIPYFFGFIFPKIAFGLVGVLIFWRRSQDWVAQLLSLMLVLFALEGISNLGALQPLADVLYGISTLLFCVLPFIFPNGRFVPRWIAWLAIPNAILSTLVVFAPQWGGSLADTTYSIMILAVFFTWFLLASYSVLYRYKYVSTPTERQQTKWATAGILGSFALFIPYTIISVFYPASQPSLERLTFVLLVFYPIYLACYLFLPGGIAIAILRYRLWDIDFIIRRTLQYSLLTGLLVLMFFGIVTILQRIFGLASGHVGRSPPAIVLSTLALAAILNPMRKRVQIFIDRRFYRKKYDAERILMNFATLVRDEVELDNLTGKLLDDIDATMQPESLSLWISKQ